MSFKVLEKTAERLRIATRRLPADAASRYAALREYLDFDLELLTPQLRARLESRPLLKAKFDSLLSERTGRELCGVEVEFESSLDETKLAVRGRNDAIRAAEKAAGIKYPRHMVWVDGAEDIPGVIILPKTYDRVYVIKGSYGNPQIVWVEEKKNEDQQRPYYIKKEGKTIIYVDGFSGGSGTQESPYLVSNRTDLEAIDDDKDAYYKLNADIDLSGSNWSPLCAYPNGFTGVLDGDGYHIYNMTVSTTDETSGLIDVVSGGTVKNLGLHNINVTGGNYTAGFINTIETNAVVDNCYIRGGTVTQLKDKVFCGGFTSYVDSGSDITNCYVQVNMVSNNTDSGSIKLGGFVGDIHENGCSLINCYAVGDITVSNGTHIGGFAGYQAGSSATITSCYWDKDISGYTASAAGTGKTTTEMKTQSTYSGWDFTNVWGIADGLNGDYPYLRTVLPFRTATATLGTATAAGLNVTVQKITNAISITCGIGTATAVGLDVTPKKKNVYIELPTATASAAGLVPTIATHNLYTLTATATATGLGPTVSLANQYRYPSTAKATAAGFELDHAGAININIMPGIATAIAIGLEPHIKTQTFIYPSTATATAAGLPHTYSQVNLYVEPTTGSAVARGKVPAQAGALLYEYPLVRDESGNLLAILNTATACRITEEINGEYKAELSLVVDELKSEYISESNFIEIDKELFRVSSYTTARTADNKTIVSAYCEHVSYDLIGEEIDGYSYGGTGYTPAQVMAHILEGTEFSVGVSELDTKAVLMSDAKNLRELVCNDFVYTYGGEIEFSRYTLNLLERRGEDRGMQIRLGKNLQGITKIVETLSGETVARYEIDFLELVGFEELERLALGDTVRVIDEELNIDVELRVVRYEYDFLQKRKSVIELGNNILNIAHTFIDIRDELNDHSGRLVDVEFKVTDEQIIGVVTASDEWTTTQSTINQQAENITLKVSKNDVINQINISTEGIAIAAENIGISGAVTLSDWISGGTTKINGGQIATDTITASQIAAGAITASEISTGTITGDKLAGTTITGDKIATGTITAGKIATATISGDKIASTTITGDNIATGAITAGKIATGTITATQIAANTITSDRIAAGTITATNIASSTITGDKIAANTVGASKIKVGELELDVSQIDGALESGAAYNGVKIDSTNGIRVYQYSGGTGNVKGRWDYGGFYLYNSAGTNVLGLNAGSGDLSLRGNIISPNGTFELGNSGLKYGGNIIPRYLTGSYVGNDASSRSISVGANILSIEISADFYPYTSLYPAYVYAKRIKGIPDGFRVHRRDTDASQNLSFGDYDRYKCPVISGSNFTVGFDANNSYPLNRSGMVYYWFALCE